MTFTAIDFETATGYRNSACAVGLVRVENGEIIDTFSALIQPPGNEYWGQNIGVHGIRPQATAYSPGFAEIFRQISHYLEGQVLVAHNASFDKSVLSKTMEHYDLNYERLRVPRWECTLKLYRAKGFNPCRLSDCCRHLDIPLNHHDALSDARACAHLFLRA